MINTELLEIREFAQTNTGGAKKNYQLEISPRIRIDTQAAPNPPSAQPRVAPKLSDLAKIDIDIDIDIVYMIRLGDLLQSEQKLAG